MELVLSLKLESRVKRSRIKIIQSTVVKFGAETLWVRHWRHKSSTI